MLLLNRRMVSLKYPGKQIEVHYDEDGRYFLVVMIRHNGEEEVLTTAPKLGEAVTKAKNRAVPSIHDEGMPYVSANQCTQCGRNMKWTRPPLPESKRVCDYCKSGKPEKSPFCREIPSYYDLGDDW